MNTGNSWRWTAILPKVLWVLILTLLLCLIVIKWPTDLYSAIALLVALGITAGVSFRRAGWQYRIVETSIMGAVTVCLIVLPLADPRALIRNVILALLVGPAYSADINSSACRPVLRGSLLRPRCPHSKHPRCFCPYCNLAIRRRGIFKRAHWRRAHAHSFSSVHHTTCSMVQY